MKTIDIDLRKFTFLDLTTDSKVIEGIIGTATESNVKGFLAEITDTVRAITFLEYAEFVDDQNLLAKINKEWVNIVRRQSKVYRYKFTV